MRRLHLSGSRFSTADDTSLSFTAHPIQFKRRTSLRSVLVAVAADFPAAEFLAPVHPRQGVAVVVAAPVAQQRRLPTRTQTRSEMKFFGNRAFLAAVDLLRAMVALVALLVDSVALVAVADIPEVLVVPAQPVHPECLVALEQAAAFPEAVADSRTQ